MDTSQKNFFQINITTVIIVIIIVVLAVLLLNNTSSSTQPIIVRKPLITTPTSISPQTMIPRTTIIPRTTVRQTTENIDCIVSDWSNWSNCSTNCGGGTQERTRSIITAPRGNGISCPVLKETITCNIDVCPVDCKVSDWSNWSNCSVSCGGGTQERTRNVITAQKGTGISCPELTQTKACNTDVCSVNCQVSDWSNWSNCSSNCRGTQERTRSIMTLPKGNGTLCPELKETKICNDNDCPLYEFTSHTFTTAGATGHEGPTISQIRNAYLDVGWAQNSEFLNMITRGIQEWKVPITGSYSIIARGAAGGNPRTYGKGRVMRTENVILNRGEIIKILVGQQGTKSSISSNAGGGGGTFVVRDTKTPIIVAGGGGGRSEVPDNEYVNSNATGNNYTTLSSSGNTGGDGSGSNNGKGGTNGNGGNGSINHAGGGGGLFGNGGNSVGGSFGGLSFVNGGIGGIERNYNSAYGGFGGGGGGGAGGGGGGGFSGGGGGYEPVWGSGGGGSSYIIPSMCSDDGAINTGQGSVVITYKYKI
jgi:hypothetical protein